METKDKVEGNKLIEIFKGERQLMPNGKMFGIKRGSLKEHENWFNIVNVEDLKYHSSWDWLMPVIEKIEEIGKRPGIYGKEVIIHSQYTSVGNYGPNYIVQTTTDDTDKIGATWQTVIKFIQWYNSQKK